MKVFLNKVDYPLTGFWFVTKTLFALALSTVEGHFQKETSIFRNWKLNHFRIRATFDFNVIAQEKESQLWILLLFGVFGLVGKSYSHKRYNSRLWEMNCFQLTFWHYLKEEFKCLKPVTFYSGFTKYSTLWKYNGK